MIIAFSIRLQRIGSFMKIICKCILFVILLIFLSLPLHSQSANWQVVDMMPLPVAGAQAVVKDSLIYILGGYLDPNNIQFSLMDSIQIYNPYLNHWEFQPVSMNIERAGFTAGVYNDAIYYAGGVWELFGNPFAFGLECWDLNAPPVFLNFSPEFARKNNTGLMNNEKIYFIGGQQPEGGDTLDLSYLIEFNIDSSAITYSLDSLYFGRDLPYHQMSALVGDDIYIFGGSRLGVSPRVYRFNTINHSYTEVAGLNSELSGGAAITKNIREIYVIGGYNENLTALDSVMIYQINPGTNTVVPGPNLNVGRRELMAVKFENHIYVFGGVNQYGFLVPEVERLDIITSIEEPRLTATDNFILFENYPNPFNSTTTISYKNGISSKIQIDIYSILGTHILNLVNEKKLPGNYEVQWNGLDKNGKSVSSGIYFYRLTASDHFSESKKMILAK